MLSDAEMPRGLGDWSQFWPDVAAALVTGLVIGAVLWLFELRWSRRREAERSTRAMQRAVELGARALSGGLYGSGDQPLPPPEGSVHRVVREVQDVTEVNDVWSLDVPAFGALHAFARYFDDFVATAEIAEGQFQDEAPGDRRSALRRYARSFVSVPVYEWDSFKESIRSDPSIGSVQDDVSIQPAIETYALAAQRLGGAREAFLLADGEVRAEYWRIALERLRNGPSNRIRRWRSDRAEHRAKRQAAAIAIENCKESLSRLPL